MVADPHLPRNDDVCNRKWSRAGAVSHQLLCGRLNVSRIAELFTMPEARLVCEGYLLKRRGAFQNRTRWFRLTTSEFQYFTAEEVGRI